MSINKKKMRDEIIQLMDEVQNHLKYDSNIDNFIDKNFAFENWGKIISKEQYPIFVIAVLNNLRSEIIMNSILNSITENKKPFSKINYQKSKKKMRPSYGELPFN